MPLRFRTKIFYLASAFAFGLLVLTLRLYTMQVHSNDSYALDADRTRTRIELLLPSRADIYDRNGVLLATNELVWDIAWDSDALFSPKNILKRVDHDPEPYGVSREDAVAFHRDQVLPLLGDEVPAPRRSNRFFALWELRSSELGQKDRDQVCQNLAAILGIEQTVLEDKLSLVEDEVNAIIANLGDRSQASRGAINSAYFQCREAMRDLEYWERIRRFPKSIRFEKNLAKRQELATARAQLVEEKLHELSESAEPLELIKADLDAAKDTLASLRDTIKALETPELDELALDVEGEVQKVERFHPLPTKEELELIDLKEQEYDLNRWAQDLEYVLQLVSEGKSTADALATLESYTWNRELSRFIERSEFRENLDSRLNRLREKIFENPHPEEGESFELKHEWNERWTSYLDFDSARDKAARLQENPLRLVRKLARERVEALEVYRDLLPGISVQARSERLYPQIDLMPHVLGAVGLPGPEKMPTLMSELKHEPSLAELKEEWFPGGDEEFDRAFRAPIALRALGVSGIERKYNDALSGAPGAKVSFRDAHNQLRSTEGRWKPHSANDFVLTIDSDVQAFAKEVVAKAEPKLRAKALRNSGWKAVGLDVASKYWSLRGSIVMMDVETGEIIAMVDFPSFDPALLSQPGEEGDAYRKEILKGDELRDQELQKLVPWLESRHWFKQAPMLSRSFGAALAPGSTFKLVSSVMLAEEGAVDPYAAKDFGPYLRWKSNGKTEYAHPKPRKFKLSTGHPAHGNVNMVEAIAQSSNEYYWHFSQLLPGKTIGEQYRDSFLKWSHSFGFGEQTGLDVPLGAQRRGTLPPSEDWVPKQLALNSIGQGHMEATPLQVARMICAIANKGKLPTPHLNRNMTPKFRTIAASDRTWTAVHKGMRQVVTGPRGTADDSRFASAINAAGKTGTAEPLKFRKPKRIDYETGLGIPDPETGEIEYDWYFAPNHAWFAGFAPYEEPKVAFVMLAEYSGLMGGHLADPVCEVVEYYLNKLDAEKAAAAKEAQVSKG